MKRVLLICVVLGSLLLMSGVIAAQESADPSFTVIATTTILADVARNIGGDLVHVEALIPADADAHAYEPTIADVQRVADADMLLVVGAGYEAFLGGLLESVGEDIPVVVASNGLEILALGNHGHDHEEDHEDEEAHDHDHAEVLGIEGDTVFCEAHSHDHADEEHTDGEEHADEDHADEGHVDHGDHIHASDCDPHVWTNPLNVFIWAANIADAFAAADPENEVTYYDNANEYAALLESIDQEIQEILSVISEDGRILVTNHEFMGYFAHQYGFEVVATILPGGTTGTEVDPQTLAELIALVQSEGVSAIFAEVSANSQLSQLVADEAGISLVTTLYSESLSAEGGNASTYIDYILYNAQTIADALK